MAKTELGNRGKPPQGSVAGSTTSERRDYGGIALEDWKQSLRKDIEERFGPKPNDLKPAAEAGW